MLSRLRFAQIRGGRYFSRCPYVNEALIKSRPLYDPVKDLNPIANVVDAPLGIGVNPSLPVHSLKELVAYDKTNPGKLSYGHVGIGSINHLTGELFKSLTGTSDIVQVPYRGGAPAMADLISGQVPIAILAVTGQFLEFHRSGKVRVLAITGTTRLSAEREIPTVAEEGFPGLTMGNSIGLFAPAGTPRAIIEQIAQASRKDLKDPAFQQMLIDLGYQPDVNSNSETFRRSLEEDVAHWTPIVKKLDLKID